VDITASQIQLKLPAQARLTPPTFSRLAPAVDEKEKRARPMKKSVPPNIQIS